MKTVLCVNKCRKTLGDICIMCACMCMDMCMRFIYVIGEVMLQMSSHENTTELLLKQIS